MTRLSRLGPAAVRAVLASGETGSATGSFRADDLIFGPDLNATGSGVGRTYLGVPRLHPVAGTDRSLGKLLRRELQQWDAGGGGGSGDTNGSQPRWRGWDPQIHPWVFCGFDKTLTALWHGTRCGDETISDPSSAASSPPRWLRYRWRDIVPSQGPSDPRFHLADLMRADAVAVSRAAARVRHHHRRDFVEPVLGFFHHRISSTPPPPAASHIVLDAIVLRAWSAHHAASCVRIDIESLRRHLVSLRAHDEAMCLSGDTCGPDAARRRAQGVRIEARLRRAEELELMLQLWTDQMLDLAYWMQREPAVLARGYADGPELDRAANLLLYPHGRRFVSLHDGPDLVPWLPYISACQEHVYWSPPGGAGGLVVSCGIVSAPAVAAMGQALSRDGSGSGSVALAVPTGTTTTNPSPHKGRGGDKAGRGMAVGGSDASKSGAKSASVRDPSGAAAAATAAAASGQGMAALAHMVLSKSTPHPCKIRNLDQIVARSAIDDPPVGLAAMDLVHILLLGNYPGCRVRPSFAVRARVRTHSLAFREATPADTSAWMAANYRLLHLAFKECYAHTVRWSPAYEALVGQVQNHTEYMEHGRQTADEVRSMVMVYGRVPGSCRPRPCGTPDFVGFPPPGAMDDAAHMSHANSLRTFGKLRKGTFAGTLCDRMRGWLRALCTLKTEAASGGGGGGGGKDGPLAIQYREEVAQLTVLSKLMQSQPEYGQRVVDDLQAARRAYAASPEARAPWRHPRAPGETEETSLEPIEPWALGAPLASLPMALIASYLKWEGDSTMHAAPWYADCSLFVAEPYPFLDRDTLAAIDLAAWMCARRTDARFVMAWLRWPIGLSASAHRRLQALYFSYEFCDVADNSFLSQLRRFLFRRRQRVISASEYRARVAARDPSIVASRVETIYAVTPPILVPVPASNTIDGGGDNTPLPRASSKGGPIRGAVQPVAYRVIEEYGTPQSRRDFAIIHEYVNRVVAYGSWSVLPLPSRVMAHQLEAVKRRQTIEPWRHTDPELLGTRHLCVCGRWCSAVIRPPLRPITSSVSERRRTTTPGTDCGHQIACLHETGAQRLAQLEEAHRLAVEQLPTALDAQRNALGTNVGEILQWSPADTAEELRLARKRLDDQVATERLALLTQTAETLAQIEATQPILYNIVPTRRVTRPASSPAARAAARSGSGSGAKGRHGPNARWAGSGGGAGGAANGGTQLSAAAALDETDLRLAVASGRWSPAFHPAPRDRASGRRLLAGGRTQVSLPVLPCASEPALRDVHPSTRSHLIGDPFQAVDFATNPHAIVSKESNRGLHCRGSLMRIQLLGQAVRPKGPRAPPHGAWHTLCATCGNQTTLDLGRWDDRGPTCGAHGRPHRLPARLAPYSSTIDAAPIAYRAQQLASIASDAEAPHTPLPRIDTDPDLAHTVRQRLSASDALAGLPCPDQVPRCWACHRASDQRAPAPGSATATTAPIAGPPPSVPPTGADGAGFGLMTLRYQVGTSAVTATAGSTGSALLARRLALTGTDQTLPVRRIVMRGSAFGALAGPGGGALLVDDTAGSTWLCARGDCDCQWRALGDFGALGKARRRHAALVLAATLPADMLPTVGEEMALKVLDDLDLQGRMQLRWIFLCPSDHKNLRLGWLELHEPVVTAVASQGAAAEWAAMGSRPEDRDPKRLSRPEYERAAAGMPLDRAAVLADLHGAVPLLSAVRHAIRRGGRVRSRQSLRYATGASGMQVVPDYGGSEAKKRRKQQEG